MGSNQCLIHEFERQWNVIVIDIQLKYDCHESIFFVKESFEYSWSIVTQNL